jgi:DNA-binding NtrC family response regulator
MQEVFRAIGRLSRSSINVLITGESGTGKELIARALHRHSPRSGGPFIALNMAAINRELLESELFGHERGAFTGAQALRRGRFEQAHGGTLFLDEIGDMPLTMQARLLRVLQERQVLPLGGGKPLDVDFQLICATHRRLRSEVEAGRFREDLYYRVNGLTLQLPALRARSDQPALVAALLRDIEPRRSLTLAPALAAAFAGYAWPGNLRQLANALRTACALLGDGEECIDWPHLPDDLAEELAAARQAPVAEDSESDLRLQAERCIEQVLRSSGGNMAEAARRLGISRNTLYRRLKGHQNLV